MKTPIPTNETERLRALLEYQILETSPEKAFDDITDLASYICNAPITAMVLVDQNRLWFKSKIGLDVSEIYREHAFCSYTIMDDNVLVVEDASQDDRFANSPLVLDEPKIRFYVGAPLITAQGFTLGTLCALDRVPRHLSAQQTAAMEALARQIVSLLELRRVAGELTHATEKIGALEKLLPICSYCRNVRNDEGYWSELEEYFRVHTGAEFTHGICPACTQKHYPQFVKRKSL